MARNYFDDGAWNVICDVCSKKIKASEAKMRWDGFIVCPLDFEMRQPQDFVKARADKITVHSPDHDHQTSLYLVVIYSHPVA